MRSRRIRLTAPFINAWTAVVFTPLISTTHHESRIRIRLTAPISANNRGSRRIRLTASVIDIEYVWRGIDATMKMVILGSNMIERAGLDLSETTKMVDKIFRGQEVGVGERDDNYKMQLEKCMKVKHNIQDGEEHILRSRWEVIQHAKALCFLTNAFVTKGKPLSEELIKDTHKTLCTNISHPKYGTTWEEYAGIYRNEVRQPGSKEMRAEVHASGTNFTPSRIVPKAMIRFIKELNSKIEEANQRGMLGPFCLAAWACADFVVIHPFLDGNGRTCRLILNAITLKYAGIVVPIGEHDEERSQYLDIKWKYSEDRDGEGEFAEMVLDRGTARLRAMGDKVKSRVRKGA